MHYVGGTKVIIDLKIFYLLDIVYNSASEIYEFAKEGYKTNIDSTGGSDL